ncbi:MAG: hypothetical protein E7263_11755 [Lachnospiraceae bacterium]|nr:hypothetical protein [Lachnospiraceae bacterium]
MDFELDEMMGIDQLELNFEAHVLGIDGECFSYSVYFNNGVAENNLGAVKKAIEDFAISHNSEDSYIGYIDVTSMDDKISIYLDLGNVEPENSNVALYGILTALNEVDGIEKVLINEGCDFDF